jgi:hypothetical protein
MERKDVEQVVRDKFDRGSKVGGPRPLAHRYQRRLHEPAQVSVHRYPFHLHFRNSRDAIEQVCHRTKQL